MRRFQTWLLRIVAVWLFLTILPVLILRFVPPPTSAYIIAQRLHDLWSGREHAPIHYHWVRWQALSPQVALAVIASEDQTFPTNWGFDFEAIARAWRHDLHARRLRGASTITQQVARNLFLCSCRSWVRKGFEAYFTVMLQALWSKHRILEVYLNIAQFGDHVYGADAAARRFFGRPPSRLTRAQAATLAAVLPDPMRLHADHPSAYVAARSRDIEIQMDHLGMRTLDVLR